MKIFSGSHHEIHFINFSESNIMGKFMLMALDCRSRGRSRSMDIHKTNLCPRKRQRTLANMIFMLVK